jgi:hypothetical protein
MMIVDKGYSCPRTLDNDDGDGSFRLIVATDVEVTLRVAPSRGDDFVDPVGDGFVDALNLKKGFG